MKSCFLIAEKWRIMGKGREKHGRIHCVKIMFRF